ncbi:hypothetical protein AAVH_16622 [Aphelenchoides avenae]|nr:hypothetical protein AAVH_16622 [Aphelenchus avenae]
MEEALREDRKCLAGHTKWYSTLHARRCDGKLPSVCFSYRQTTRRGEYCKQDPGKQWMLFQGKCYYVYSAPSKDELKTYFEAQNECKKMKAVLAKVSDEATFKKMLELATGPENIQSVNDGTWIGLQLSGMGYGGVYYNITDGTRRKFTKFREPPMHDDEQPSLLPPEKIEGWWEDGTRYDGVALEPF